ncbi:MAG: translation initiation factor [Terrimicrobiaceae bacterium]|jgi:translation initiation factor 1|nr:translation initiation factor [Terrimicrobiaceae bacterium]
MSARGRIPVSGPREDLQSPFAGLSIPDLPEGVLQVEKPARHSPGRVVLRKEKSHRGGKPVIVVSGFSAGFPVREIERLASEARKQLGCGGTVRDREMEFQGDNPAAVRKVFQAAGFRVDGI